jgi:hypothetical protein
MFTLSCNLCYLLSTICHTRAQGLLSGIVSVFHYLTWKSLLGSHENGSLQKNYEVQEDRYPDEQSWLYHPLATSIALLKKSNYIYICVCV